MSRPWIDSQSDLGRECQANILVAYSRATGDQKARGIVWYRSAHSFAAGLALDGGLHSTDSAAGIIAALSPQQSWPTNCENATRLVIDPSVRVHTDLQMGKALEIYDGADWRQILKGPKELSFADNISNPKRSQAVTVDRHAVRVALGAIVAQDKCGPEVILQRKRVYDTIAQAYRDAAKGVGMLPLEIQAITWLQERE